MAHDPSRDPAPPSLVSPPRSRPGPLLIAGVAGACILGAGLGFWARPDGIERPAAPRHHLRPPLVAPAPRRIEIRVDGGPPAAAASAPQATAAPIQAPAPVQPPAAVAAPAPPPAELLAPKPPPNGLMRVRAVVPAQLAGAPAAPPRAPPPPAPTPDPALARKAAAARAKAEAAEHALAARQAEAARVAAQAAAEKREAARLEKARLAAEKAKAEKRAERLAAERVAAERAERLEKARLAEAQAETRREARLAAKARAEAAAREAEADRRSQAQAAARSARAKAAPAHGSGPLRTAGLHARCASPDPGAALACADPALSAAERQLDRAYREAQAAGVPEDKLERQQQRWLAARATAARQTPWAVHDIYLARIAELQDQTRQATIQGD